MTLIGNCMFTSLARFNFAAKSVGKCVNSLQKSVGKCDLCMSVRLEKSFKLGWMTLRTSLL